MPPAGKFADAARAWNRHSIGERGEVYRMIVGDGAPNFRTISDFCKRPLSELQGLFVQVLKLCA
jgi:hypothetical protein